jgi:hypothetical protein
MQVDEQLDDLGAPAQSAVRRSGVSSLAAGGVLVALGVLLLLGQIFDFRLGRFFWPFYIIVPGVLLFAISLTMDQAGEGVAIAGSIVTMVGLVLLYQNTMHHWQSWAYAWALVAPTSIGLGQATYGVLKNRQHVVKSGLALARIGGIIFLVGVVFFELVIGISGFRYIGWPALLIAAGVLLLVRNFTRTGSRI